MKNSEKLAKTEARTENADRVKAVESAQECVVKNKKSESLNTVNRDLDSDEMNNTVDMCDIISRVKQDLLS